MTKIYVVRHAEAEGNLYRRIHGVYDSLITESGHRQVEYLKKRFENIHIDAVYSSDLTRTKQTAAAIYIPKGLPLYTTPQLREINMGIWEDVTWGDVYYKTPDILEKYNHDSFNWHIDGCESFEELTERMLKIVMQLGKKHEGESIAVVTHGTAIRALLLYVLGMSRSDIEKLPYSDNTAVSLLNYSNGKLSAEYYNDNSHLPEEQSTFARQHWWKSKAGAKFDYNMRYEPINMKADKSIYAAAYADAWRIAHGSLKGFDEQAYVISAERRLEKFPNSIVQAYIGNEKAGIIDLNIDADCEKKIGNIAFYYMQEKFRNRDIGVQLLGYAVSVYRALGREKLCLRTAESNKAARRFYERYGFVKVGEQQGVAGKLLVLEKDILMPKFPEEVKL